MQGGEGTELGTVFTEEPAPEGSTALEHEIIMDTDKKRILIKVDILIIGN